MTKKLPAIPYVVWMAIFVVAPLVLVVVYALTTPDGQVTLANMLEARKFLGVFGRSFGLALIATVICLILGYPVAYAFSREGERFRSVAMMLIMLPRWMNFLLRTYAWVTIIENTGLLNQVLGFLHLPKLHIINTPAAVVLGMVYDYLPFMILPIYSVIIKLDGSLIEAARDLGADSYRVFTKIIFPLSIPGVISGVTMVFVPSVSTFVISKLLGGGKDMLVGDLIELQFLGGAGAYNPQLGSAVALVMMIIILICMSLMNRFGGGDEEVVLL
ncbi:MAG: ABC transporter permease [Oscillospiraceae bacterium]|nr:ABC transporter permease [Oscillospiraceae bacterium]